MKTIFADTSALYAYLVAEDRYHPRAKQIGSNLIQHEETLVTHSFIICEMTTLLQSRIGLDAVEQWHQVLLPLLDVTWVDAPLYQRAVLNLLSSGRRQVSITDHISFELMRQREISTAFAFDPHFKQFGFQVL